MTGFWSQVSGESEAGPNLACAVPSLSFYPSYETIKEPHGPTASSENGDASGPRIGGDVEREHEVEQLVQRLSSLTINTVNSRCSCKFRVFLARVRR